MKNRSFEGNTPMAAFTYDEFVSDLRSALHYLYDPVHLRRSPLVRVFGLVKEFDPAAALQNLLTGAIHSMKPGEDEPPQSPAWHIYDILNLQYLRQFERDMVAGQLGISDRQLRREQRLALEALAQVLWQRHRPAGSDLAAASPLAGKDTGGLGGEHLIEPPEPGLATELAGLKDPAFQQLGPLADVFATITHLTAPLAKQWKAPLEIALPEDLADIPVPHLVLRNILLTVLSVAIPRSGERPVCLEARWMDGILELVIAGQGEGVSHPLLIDHSEPSMQAALSIVGLYGVTVEFPTPDNNYQVYVRIAAARQTPVLVIDDNPDWHELLKRYAVGSRFRVIGSRDPQTALGLARSMQPALIVLDVMMPNVDGWQILSILRGDPQIGAVPIILCSILPLEGLALSLGVNAFLQKPVTQEQFLAALEKLLS